MIFGNGAKSVRGRTNKLIATVKIGEADLYDKINMDTTSFCTVFMKTNHPTTRCEHNSHLKDVIHAWSKDNSD